MIYCIIYYTLFYLTQHINYNILDTDIIDDIDRGGI